MKRPRFALSIMLGAMAASISALGFPPVSNSPAAVGGSPNAALICPASSLAAESHPFHWFERSEAGPPEVAVDNWLLTIRAPADSAEAAAPVAEASSSAAAPAEVAVAEEAVEEAAVNAGEAVASDDVALFDANYCDGACQWDCQTMAEAQSPCIAEAASSDIAASTPAAMSLDACDLSIAECEEEYESARTLALELCGLAWIDESGICEDFRLAAPEAVATTSDASDLAADYRHSTGLADALRLNMEQGRPRRVVRPNVPAAPIAAPSADVSFEEVVANDLVLSTLASSADAYAKFYRLQQSADEVAGWMQAIARNVTSGLSDVLDLAAVKMAAEPTDAIAEVAPEAAVEVAKVPVHTISIVRPRENEFTLEGFELVSESDSRFVFVRATPVVIGGPVADVEVEEPSVANSFELVIDGPNRFLFLRKQGFKAPQEEPARSVAVLLPRPVPPAASIGIDADWLAWDYFRFQVEKVMELSNCNTTGEAAVTGTDISSHDSLACDDFDGPEAWDCLAYARQDDSIRDQIKAEEAASDGRDDTIQALIREQAEAEGANLSPSDSLDAIAPLGAPTGCHGEDPVGCLSHRAQLRTERFAQSAAWSIHKLAALLDSFADELRNAAGVPATEPSPSPTAPTSTGGDLEPSSQRTASQRFLSELYLGL